MTMLLEVSVMPAYAQVELSAADAATYPDWPTGKEAAVADASTVAVATRPDSDGPVRVIVGPDLSSTTTEAWSEVWQGTLTSHAGRYRVGSGLGGNLVDVPVLAQRLRVRVFVRPSVEPVEVGFEITHR
jgi:hypothetical protein